MKKIPAPTLNAAGAEPEVAIHLQRREPDVRSIEEVEDVEHEHERDQPQRDPSHRLLLER
jgi:hypothetical protein